MPLPTASTTSPTSSGAPSPAPVPAQSHAPTLLNPPTPKPTFVNIKSKQTYLDEADAFLDEGGINDSWDYGWGFSWDEKLAGINVLKYILTSQDTARTKVVSYLSDWASHDNGEGLAYQPTMRWGLNRYASNSALLG